MIRICIVEDNQLLLNNLRLLLEGERGFSLSGTFTNGEDALKHTDWANTDIILADIDLPGMDGVAFIAAVKLDYPHVDALAYTISEERNVVMGAIRAGASGYLLKGSTPRVLIESLRELYEGGAPMSPRIARKMIHELRGVFALDAGDSLAPVGQHLSPAEIRVIKLIEKGLTYGEVSLELNISPHTVHTHIKRVYEKVHASSRTELLAKARRLGAI